MLFLEIAVFLQGGLLGIPFLTRVETPVCSVRASVSREGSHCNLLNRCGDTRVLLLAFLGLHMNRLLVQ